MLGQLCPADVTEAEPRATSDCRDRGKGAACISLSGRCYGLDAGCAAGVNTAKERRAGDWVEADKDRTAMQANAHTHIFRQTETSPIVSVDDLNEAERVMRSRAGIIKHHVHSVTSCFDVYSLVAGLFVVRGDGANIVLEKQWNLILA